MRTPPVDSGFTDVGGMSLYDRRAGAGAAVVCVHGLAVSSRYFEPLVRELSSTYDARALDLPGFGRSGSPPEVLDVPGLADALAGWLRATGLQTAALVGNSAGCQYIVDCVSRHDDITGPVVLIGPTTDSSARTARAQVGRWLGTGRYRDVTQLPIVLRDCRDAGVHRVGATFRSILHDPIEDKLPLVRQPVLVLRGSQDPIVPRRWAEQVAWLLPDARLIEIAGGAHVVNFTKPAQVAREIRNFLQVVGYGS